MKLESAVSEIESSGVLSSTAFSIAMNAKAFKALSSTIYQNKQGSIVRELSCNAYDAHVMAGCPEKPFEIHLPDDFEPWFSVKDFGVGLSEVDIISVFSTFFESSKDQSNDVIGAFGLGAKTPFSYTDQFTVTTIVSGVKSIYSAFIGPGGFPEICKMHTEGTTEGNGVEVHMQVKREDFIRFRSEVRDQLKFFKVKPIIRNHVGWHWVEHTIESKFDSFELYSSNSLADNYIVQGQVGYKLTQSDLKNINADILKFLKDLMTVGKRIVMHMPIGTVGVTISREAVEFDDRTLGNIENAIKKAIDQISEETKKTLDSLGTEFEIAKWLQMHRPLGYSQLAVQYCPNLSGTYFYLDFSKTYNVTFIDYSRVHHREHYSNTLSVGTTQDTRIIVADVNSMMVKRTESLLRGGNKVWTIRINSRKDGTPVTAGDYKQIVEEVKKQIPGFTDVRLASEIVVAKVKNPVKYVSAQYYSFNHSWETKNWKKQYEGIDDLEDDCVYVVVDRLELVNYTRDQQAINQYIQASQFMQLLPLVAIRKLDEKKVGKMTNMQSLHEYMADVGKNQPFDVREQKLHRLLQIRATMSACSDAHVIEKSASNLSCHSEFAKFFQLKAQIDAKLQGVNLADLNNKAAYYGWKLPTKEVVRIQDRWQKLLDKVPLVKYIHNSDLASDLVDYINAMKV